MNTSRSSDIIIVGGGLLGTSAAYHLARRQAGKITLLERMELASQASSRAACLLTRVRTQKAVMDMVQETYQTIEEIESELGESLDLRQSGSLTIASGDATLQANRALEKTATQYGIPTKRLTAGQVKEQLPWINPETVQDALYIPTDAFIDSARLCNGYARVARKRGVEIRTRTAVQSILTRDGAVSGVLLESGEKLSAPVVIDAAGAWANLLSFPLGIGLPMTPVRSHFWITESNPALFPPGQPFAVLPDARAFTRPDVGGLIIGLREPECVSYDPASLTRSIEDMDFTPDGGWSVLSQCARDFERYFPALRTTGIAHYVAGPSCYVPDGTFIIGPVEHLTGLYALTGCCGAGIAAGGGMGRLIAEQVTGQGTFVDATPFAPSRLGRINPFNPHFQQSCALARSNKKAVNMKQIVFLKQVPASTRISIDPVTHTLLRSGNRSRTNPDDLHALQLAVELRKKRGGTITAVTMGPPQARSVLQEALLYGADQAILLSDPLFAGSDTWSTSHILAAAVRKLKEADLLLFGKQALDGDTAQVGPGVAAQLHIPQLTEVQAVIDLTPTHLVVRKTFDSGIRILRSTLPCVVTVNKEANELSTPTLQNWEETQLKKILHWDAKVLELEEASVGLSGSPTRVVRTEAISSHRSIRWIHDIATLQTVCTKLS
ncbi:MAG: FAD-dependent oxidoreductase [Bacteroides sp.]|nr:FAD-dependent oxidoreductase [Bacteroides sp.]